MVLYGSVHLVGGVDVAAKPLTMVVQVTSSTSNTAMTVGVMPNMMDRTTIRASIFDPLTRFGWGHRPMLADYSAMVAE